MKEGKTLTFVELIKEVNWIQIPILQRDYAQGRKDASDVRRQFLQAIKKTLIIDESQLKHPLDLDFVYGSFEGENNIFSVLDGQQRLTTLFLLHWYLAVKENRLTDFENIFINQSDSRFTYQTRTSAREFFNSLAMSKDILVNQEIKYLSQEITNKRWFFISWRDDPTVQSCLRMLDSIHSEFVDCTDNLYLKLINTENPYIVFQYLNLDSFGLSDELYIKMNARGKPLTNFENFKAWLCSALKDINIGNEFETKLDQQWTDLFWGLSQHKNTEFDTLYLRFFNLLAFFDSCEKVEQSYDLLDVTEKQWISRLRLVKGQVAIDEFSLHNSFNEVNLYRIQRVLDYFCGDSVSAYASNLLKDNLNTSDYVRQAKFYAMILFINQALSTTESSLVFDSHFSEWIRVTNNLINNHRIDELTSFIPVIRTLKELSSNCINIYQYIAENGLQSGFTKPQRDEETLKSRLILKDKLWENLFIKFESHQYLQGKVGFLLEMAKIDEEHYDTVKFNAMGEKTVLLLNDDILSSEQFILQRALLTIGDYMVFDGSDRYSFCLPNRSSYRERSENWLRVVVKPEFKLLLENISIDIRSSLNLLISNVNCGGWREFVVKNPEVIKYCRNRLISKKSSVLIYLLSKSTFRGFFAELKTYILSLHLTREFNHGHLSKNVKSIKYHDVYGDEVPTLMIELLDEINLSIAYDGEAFFILDATDKDQNSITFSMPKFLEVLINDIFPQEAIR